LPLTVSIHGFSAVLDRKWPGGSAFAGAGSELSGVWCDLALGSVSQHHPDALTSMTKL
jgi:hypothetical protein